jgi:ankyrin repeat protein
MPEDQQDPSAQLVDNVQQDPTAQLVDNIQQLAIKGEKQDGVDEGVESKDQDDGYSSASSECGLANLVEKVGDLSLQKDDEIEEKKEEDGDRDEAEDDDDEKILEPLILVEEVIEECPKVEFLSRGPVSVNSENRSRFNPYQRGVGRPDQIVMVPLCQTKDDEPRHQPLPNLLIPTNRDPEHLHKIETKIEWADQHELSIAKYKLPADVILEASGAVKMYVQLDPSVRDMKSFLADVKIEKTQDGEIKYIGPILISIKQDLMDSQEKMLLAEVKEEDFLAARDLVYNKDISDLVTVIGPRQDTVLAILCAKGKTNPGPVTSQIYFLIQRLLKSPDPQHIRTVFKLNKNGISAFEIAAITNNSLVACYLAEVIYNLCEDTCTALKVLNAKDRQGNSIVHLLARKGDSNVETLRRLLNMRLTDNTRVFSLSCNSKQQSPLHIAVHSGNQPETIAILNQAIKNGFDAQDDDGMTPLHYAAQRSSDPQLIQTILSYKKDNINLARKDGLTPLDLVNLRPIQAPGGDNSAHQGYAIDKKAQYSIVKLLEDNGAKSSTEDQMSPLTIQNGYGTMESPNTPHSPNSPMGSPYSSTASPRTLPDDCPGNIYSSMNIAGSVESYVQSSPESEHCDYSSMTSTRNYSFIPDMFGYGASNPHHQEGFNNQPHSHQANNHNTTTNIPANGGGGGQCHGGGGSSDLEDHIASQILNEFPEIRSYVGQIIDGNL